MPSWQTAKSWIAKSLPGLVAGAIMYASQVTPDQATSNLSTWIKFFGFTHAPEWIQSRSVDQWVFWGALLFLFAYGAVILWKRYFSQGNSNLADLMYPKATWREKVFGSSVDNEGKLMPLSEAALKLSEAAKQGKIPTAAKEVITGQPASAEDILNLWAAKISNSWIALYGRKTPVNQLDRIPVSDRSDFIFKDGGKTLHHPADAAYYYDLSVKQKEFEGYYNCLASFDGD